MDCSPGAVNISIALRDELVKAAKHIQKLESQNAEKDARIQQLKKEKLDLLEERELNDFLRDKVKQLEAERDAAVTFLPRRCYLCKHVGNKMGDAPCPSFYEYITLEECPNWQWRGVQKEN